MGHIYDTGKRAAVADGRTTLEAFLAYYRAAMVGKARGVSDEQARRQLVPSARTLGGILKHLRRGRSSGSNTASRKSPKRKKPPATPATPTSSASNSTAPPATDAKCRSWAGPVTP
jgi:hypothetical protein